LQFGGENRYRCLHGRDGRLALSAVHHEVTFMPRTVLALAALLCSFSPALATLSPQPASPFAADTLAASLAVAPQDKPLPPDVVKAAYPPGRDEEFRITSQTEVLLNGRPCCYADVPRNAGVVKMEVSSDNQTVLKIQFRTRK
jgi:hypothetical protein